MKLPFGPSLDIPAWVARHSPPSWLTEPVRFVADKLDHIERKIDQMATDQEHLDADVAALTAATAAVEQELAALKAQPAAAALDFTALDAAVARLQGDAPVSAPPASGPPPAPSA